MCEILCVECAGKKPVNQADAHSSEASVTKCHSTVTLCHTGRGLAQSHIGTQKAWPNHGHTKRHRIIFFFKEQKC